MIFLLKQKYTRKVFTRCQSCYMGNSIILMKSIKKYFSEMKNPRIHKKFYDEAKEMSNHLNIKLSSAQVRHRIKKIAKKVRKKCA